MSKHRRTISYRNFLNMFPDKYSWQYNVYCVRSEKNRARVMYGRFRPADSELWMGYPVSNSNKLLKDGR